MRKRLTIPRQPVIGSGRAARIRPIELPSLFDLPDKILTRSGRSAIVLALKLLGIGRGDRVLVPTYHCPTMIAPVERVGASPAFYAITHCGSPDLDRLGSFDTSDVRAMLVPHLFGLPIPLEDVANFCRRRDIALIEDCAHCFFGRAGRLPIGVTGDLAVGSLPKFFPLVEGGILASSKKPLATLQLPSRHARSEFRAAWDLVDIASRSGRLGPVGALMRGISRAKLTMTSHFDEPLDPSPEPAPADIRSLSLADPLLDPAALSLVEKRVLVSTDRSVVIDRRRENYRSIAEALVDVPNARPLFPDCGENCAPYVMPLLVLNPDAPYARMRAAGLPVFRWDRLWPCTPIDPTDAAATWSRQVIQVACHQGLRDDEIDSIRGGIRECLFA